MYDGRTHEHVHQAIEEALAEVPVFDIHTHLVGGQLGARGLHDVLLYHMVISDLYAAGCPSGARLTQYPGEPSRGGGPRSALKKPCPSCRPFKTPVAFGASGSFSRNLYGWNEAITAANWRKLDGADPRTRR